MKEYKTRDEIITHIYLELFSHRDKDNNVIVKNCSNKKYFKLLLVNMNYMTNLYPINFYLETSLIKYLYLKLCNKKIFYKFKRNKNKENKRYFDFDEFLVNNNLTKELIEYMYIDYYEPTKNII